MKYYKDNSDNVYAFENETKQVFIDDKIAKLGLTSITKEELLAIKTQQDIDNQVAEKTEIQELKQFLSNSNYIAINYGALRSEEKKDFFLADISNTYNKTNEEILDERDDAIARINELSATLTS